MAMTLTGGCMCGAIRYECSAQPVWSGHCYCRDCQRASGTAFSSNLLVPKAALKLQGEVKYYESTADSGNKVKRGFCPNCGSPVLGVNSAFPDFASLRAGSLDDPAQFKPLGNFYRASAAPWAPMSRELPTFERMLR